MTELESLAKDCIENHTHKLVDKPTKQDIYWREESIYIQGYKECERQSEKKVQELKTQLKTAYRKGMRHFANALKEYDRTEGAWTDYFEHTVDRVLKQELEKLK